MQSRGGVLAGEVEPDGVVAPEGDHRAVGQGHPGVLVAVVVDHLDHHRARFMIFPEIST